MNFLYCRKCHKEQTRIEAIRNYEGYVSVLASSLNCDQDFIRKSLIKNYNLKRVSEKKLKNNIDVLRQSGFSDEKIK